MAQPNLHSPFNSVCTKDESLEVVFTDNGLTTPEPLILTLQVQGVSEAPKPDLPPRDFRFWLVFLAIGVSTLITALELSAVSTALPTIVNDLHGTTFVWVGSAYALAATAFIPLSGGLAQVFGRRPVMLLSLFLMALGSALCGACTSMNFLIGGRTVQGIGGGGIASITAIIISDLVPLRERGVFNGLIGIFWSLGSGIGPIVGGGLAKTGMWRWLFYLNLPICGVAAVLIMLFLRVRTPPGTLVEKLKRVDWIGTALVVGATTACILGLTWSGIQYSWGSAPVLAPLIIGLVGLVVFLVYESIHPKIPLIPFSLMNTLTGASGYAQTFIMPIVMLGLVYYIPVYFQACKGASPLGAGVDQLSVALVTAPIGIMSGVSVNKTQRYRPQLWAAWLFLMLGTGLLITLDADTQKGHAIGFLILAGIGIGILVTTTYFPVLAPLSVTANAPALAYFMFLRNFAQVWGVTVGGTVLQNELRTRLPAAFVAQFPQGTGIAYAIIPLIESLPEPLKSEVRVAFAQSLRIVWEVMVGIAGAGLVASLLMQGLPLHTSTDRSWELENEESK